MLKVLLADDEPGILALLENIVATINGITIVGRTQTIEATKECFIETEPDIVILDIQFPDGSGVDLARKLVMLDSDIDLVFITAHPGFTLKAFELYSYDYILKPIEESRVIRTIMQIKKERELLLDSSPLSKNSSNNGGIRLGIRTENEILLINSEDILFIERAGKSVYIHTTDNSVETKETLHNLESKLPSNFFRSHKACLVNLNHINKIVPWNNNAYQIKFKKSEQDAFLSRRRTNELLRLLDV